jgi:hypothetical protein
MYDLPGTPDLNLLIPQLSSIRVVDRPDIGPTGSSRKCAHDGRGSPRGSNPPGRPSPEIQPRIMSVVPGYPTPEICRPRKRCIDGVHNGDQGHPPHLVPECRRV